MKSRNLLSSPPAYLGFFDFENWTDEALWSLAVEAFVFSVVSRRKALAVRLRAWGNIDGLVLRNVRNFLIDRQRAADPIGRAVYQNIKDSSEAAAASGLLVRGAPASSDLVQWTVPDASSAPPAPPIEQSLKDYPDNIQLFRDITSSSQAGRRAARVLLEYLGSIGTRAVPLGGLARLVAQRSRSLNTEMDANDPATVALLWAPHPGMQKLDFLDLITTTKRGIDEGGYSSVVQNDLHNILDLLVAGVHADEDRFLSRDIREALGMPSSTLSDRMKLLRSIVEGRAK